MNRNPDCTVTGREYKVRAKKEGFAEGIRTGIRLVVGQDASADLSLRIGAVSQELSGDAALVRVTTQDISGLVREQQVRDLPLNGRSCELSSAAAHWGCVESLGAPVKK